MRNLNIAIAGCGIAGLAAALALTRQGHRTVLFERFETPRPIGSGLMIQPTGLSVLAALRLAEQAVAHGAPVSRLYGLNAQGEKVLDARYADLSVEHAFGLGIHRASLFGILWSAAQNTGVEIEVGRCINGSDHDGKTARLNFDDGTQSAAFDLIIDASGTRSTLAPECGQELPFGALWTTLDWPEDGPFDPALLEQRYRMASEMVGVLPTGQTFGTNRRQLAFFWSLQADRHAAWRDAGLEGWKEEVRALWPQCEGLLEQITDSEQMVFARYAHRCVPRPVDGRLVHIGDAWHSASPQLGQGANMALLDAWALSKAIGEGPNLSAALGQFVQLRQRHVKLYQAVTAFFTPLYQSARAAPAVLRDFLFAPLSRVPPGPAIQARLMGGLAGAPLGKLGLQAPDFAALRKAVQAPASSSTRARASSLAQS
ncbi:FAD-dependent oxidoreductase [Paraurantiacibacter namhicola]|nr:NAD(P)/FAD-dependent oxidoreductase [Paraurantiacibacter namhicola]